MDMYVQKYEPLIPQINLITQQFTYEPSHYTYVNNNAKINLPTESELKQAEQYKDKIPDYKVSSANGQFHAGVIIDEPGYSSSDYNQPPPAFAQYGGDREIDKKLINPSGGVPNNFNNNQINSVQVMQTNEYQNQGYPNSNHKPKPSSLPILDQGFSSSNFNAPPMACDPNAVYN